MLVAKTLERHTNIKIWGAKISNLPKQNIQNPTLPEWIGTSVFSKISKFINCKFVYVFY